MLKSLILIVSLVVSGMAHGDFQSAGESHREVRQTASAGDILGGLLIGVIIGKILKDKKKKKKNKPVPKPQPITEKVRIPMHGELAVGSNTIYLRSELNDMGVDLRGRRLKSVTLVAKSKAGKGNATLQLGQTMKPTKGVLASQNGFHFHDESRESYRRIKWNANRDSDVIWQIHLRGRIKVKAVIVELD